MREKLRKLYRGTSPSARAFRFGILAFDVASIVFFVVSSILDNAMWIYVIDAIIAP